MLWESKNHNAMIELTDVSSTIQWSVTTNSELFNVSGNHVNDGDEVEENMDINIDTVSMFLLWISIGADSRAGPGEDGVADVNTDAEDESDTVLF